MTAYLIPYQRYIDFARDHKNATAITITNYVNAVRTCGIPDFDADDVNGVWKYLLVKLESGTSYGAIRLLFILTQAAMRLEGRTFVKDYDFNLLHAKLRKCGSVPKGYDVEQAGKILKILEKESLEIFRIVLLQIYSGLRISACQGLTYDAFVKIDPYDVYCFPVFSKNRHYIGAISGYAYRLLQQTNYQKSKVIVNYDASLRTPFAKLYRKQFVYILQKHASTDILAGKSPFHSFRKLYAQLLAESKLMADDISELMGHSNEGASTDRAKEAMEFKKLLMGQSPGSVAYKHYIDGEAPGLYKKVAEIYSKTKFMELKIYD